MNTTLLRTSALRSAARAAAPTVSRAGLAGTTFVRGKATLPDLSCKLT
jgi:Fe-Mn family superoxide dismutase